MSAIMMTDTAMAGHASPVAGELQKKLRDACWRWAGVSADETVLANASP